MQQPEITVYGAYWCPDCRQTKKFLGEQFIPYHWVDIEQNAEGEQRVLALNDGKRIIPTVVFADGSFLVEPSNAELARKLDLTLEARLAYYDVIIVGGGPAGLTAAIYAAREGVDVLVIERSGLGGQAGLTAGIDNFPGFPEGIGGLEFAERVVQQARRFEVEILQATEVTKLDRHGDYHCILNAAGDHHHARAVLLATGAAYRRLGVPGEDDYIGAGIHFCATCDGPFYKGAQEIVVVGSGNSALEEGLHLTRYADRVTILARGEKLNASRFLTDKITSENSKVKIRYHTAVEAFEGENGKLKSLRVRDTRSEKSETLTPAAAFIFIGQQPNSQFVRNYVETDERGFILTGHDLEHLEDVQRQVIPFAFETSVSGVFAAGDVRHGSVNQVASAVGEGAAAAIVMRDYLRKLAG